MLDVGRVVRHRLFRESCYNHKGNYVKVSLLRDLYTCMTDKVGSFAARPSYGGLYHHRQFPSLVHLPPYKRCTGLNLVQRPSRHRVDGSLSLFDRPRHR